MQVSHNTLIPVLIAGVLVLFLIAVSLYAAVSISMCRLRKEEDILIEDGIESEVRLVTGFVHNGA